jgi:hypothetical protein
MWWYINRQWIKIFDDTGAKPDSELQKPVQWYLDRVGSLLYIKTAVVKVRIGTMLLGSSDSSHSRRFKTRLYSLVDSLGRCVGEISTSQHVADKMGTRDLDCVNLSQGRCPTTVDPAIEYIPTTTNPEGNLMKLTRSSWVILNILLIEWDGEVARRVASGKIMQTYWNMNSEGDRWVFLG